MLKKWIFVLPVFALFLTGCNFSSDDLAMETLEISDFSSLSLELYADVNIFQGETYSVEIEAPEKMLNEIEISQEQEDSLVLSTKRWITSSDPLKVTVVVPDLNRIFATHNTNVFLSDYSDDELMVALSENAKFKGENLNIENSLFSLVQNTMFELSGSAVNVDVKLNNNAIFSAKDFLAQNLSIDHNSFGLAELNVSDKLIGQINSTGDIKNFGNADVDIAFGQAEDLGIVLDAEENVILQNCSLYAADECPETCRLCPPCPACSSLQCQTKQACDAFGFEEGWLE